jgi:hypothetical protein
MKKYTSWIVIVVAVALVVWGIAWYAGKPGQYDTFASCIRESGAKFYGAFWCPHCQDQKKLFGKSAKELPYIECSTPNGQGQTAECAAAGIEGYPTWDFASNGTTTRKSGLLGFAELSELTSCPATPDAQ